MKWGYVGGNGKSRIYCTNCIIQAIHVFTLIREDMAKFTNYELTQEVKELKQELERRRLDSLPVPPQGSYEG
jgi:hypothetical protein